MGDECDNDDAERVPDARRGVQIGEEGRWKMGGKTV